MKIEDARIYVGTYGKYNDGSLFGEWIELAQFSDKYEFYAYCQKLHSDEPDCELMFQDFEGIPSDLIGECWVSDSVWAFFEKMEELGEDQAEAFMLWADNMGHDLEETENLISSFQEAYLGEYESETAYAEQYMEETGQLDQMPKNLRYYFDFEAFGRDLFMSDLVMLNNHVFYNN